MATSKGVVSIEQTSIFPGFKFSPTDVELISYYLKKKLEGDGKCVEVIPELEICKHEPWDLPAKSIVQSETEWFFFSMRGRKYPNGSQSKRATQLGYWKATGNERSVRSGSAVIGIKRTLVFHIGRAPKGERTEWIMHEYCMYAASNDSLVVCRLQRKVGFRGHNSSCNDNNERNTTTETTTEVESSKKTNSSSGSHSIEQQYVPQSSSHHHDHDDLFQLHMLEESCRGLELEFSENAMEDDFYADIVNLDDQLSAGLAAPAIQGLAPLWLLPQHQDSGTRAQQQEQNWRRVGAVAAAVREKEEARERERREDEEAEKERQKREKKMVPNCAVGLVMFVKKKRAGKAVAVLFVVGVLVLVVLLTLFGSLFGHDKVSGKIRKLAHIHSFALGAARWIGGVRGT